MNACARLLRRQAQGPHGGFGGRRLQRHHMYSRFRLDEQGYGFIECDIGQPAAQWCYMNCLNAGFSSSVALPIPQPCQRQLIHM